jgi:drug/metabolite transporter (DMT)-like permease
MKLQYLIILIAMNFFWAAVYSVYKVIGEDGGAGTGAIVTLRFGLAAVVMLLGWQWYPGPAPKGRDLALTFVMGLVLFVLGQRLQVYGNQIGTAGNSSVLMALEPLITSVAAALFLREHLGPRRLCGFALGLLGVAVLNRVWDPSFHWTSLGASLIFISSFICEAAYSVIGKPIVGRSSALKMIAISLVVGTLLNLVIDGATTLSVARGLPLKSWLLLVAMAVISTAVGYSVWFVIIRHCAVNVASLTVFSQAIFGVIIAWSWVGEKLHWGHLFGSLTIVAGLILGLSRQIEGKESEHAQS